MLDQCLYPRRKWMFFRLSLHTVVLCRCGPSLYIYIPSFYPRWKYNFHFDVRQLVKGGIVISMTFWKWWVSTYFDQSSLVNDSENVSFDVRCCGSDSGSSCTDNKVYLHGPPSSSSLLVIVNCMLAEENNTRWLRSYISLGCQYWSVCEEGVRATVASQGRDKYFRRVTNPALSPILNQDRMLYQVLPSRIFVECKIFEVLGTLHNSSIQIQIDEHRILPTQ